ncbi:MAG: hypothetical protein E6R13_00135 [Spirochaetes bacterium]|nr:MAG: hypothetical protein E6R13_00135 [Spirochaetota bacterium]
MKNTKTTYNNRYGDVYTFTVDDDGNVLWEGSFEHHRIAWPNDYTEAYAKYLEDSKHIEQPMSLEQFKEVVHQYDDETSKYIYPDYVKLVGSDRSKISMVDPSGGPYIAVGMELRYVDVGNKKVKGFEWVKTGYKILLEHE